MSDGEIETLARELSDSALAIRAALLVIPPTRQGKWIALMKSDREAGMLMAREHGWTIKLAIEQAGLRTW